jgi:hypothetical protein
MGIVAPCLLPLLTHLNSEKNSIPPVSLLLTGLGTFWPFCYWPVRDMSWLGVALVYHSHTFRGMPSEKKLYLLMKFLNVKRVFAAFEANQINPSQQLKVKGGDDGSLPVIGHDDIITG